MAAASGGAEARWGAHRPAATGPGYPNTRNEPIDSCFYFYRKGAQTRGDGSRISDHPRFYFCPMSARRIFGERPHCSQGIDAAAVFMLFKNGNWIQFFQIK